MSNWVNCDGTWTNLTYLRYIYPAPIEKKDPNTKWIIEAEDGDNTIDEFLLEEFNTEKEAQEYLNYFMKESLCR